VFFHGDKKKFIRLAGSGREIIPYERIAILVV
jgi:hypothetical protein